MQYEICADQGSPSHRTGTANIQLSLRQREVLIWTAQGKTTWETSRIMQCTESTVNYHLKQVFRKLQANNKTHAVTRALDLGLISRAWR